MHTRVCRGMTAALFATGLIATAIPPAAAADADAVPKRIDRPTIKGPQEGDPLERIGSIGIRRITDEQKANFIRELVRKQTLYPNQAAGAPNSGAYPAWRSIGPRTSQYSYNGVFIDGIDSGRMRDVLVDPANANRVFVLTSGGGLWRTDNFSAPRPRWTVLTDGLISTSGGSAAFGRTSNTIYLGIGDPFDVYPTIAGVMVKSTDGGRTWSPFVILPGATAVRDVKVDTSGPSDVVLAATDVGLYRSTDGGATYTLTNAGQDTGLASAWSIVRSSAGWLANMVDPNFDAFVGGTGELYRSTDRGATWTRIPAAANPFTTVGRATLAVARPGESTVYAIASTPDLFAQADVFRSKDGGLSWQALNVTKQTPANPNCFQPDMNILGDQAWYNQMIVVSPSDPKRNTVYIGGNLSSAKTTNGGANWTLTSSWLPTACDGVSDPALPYVHADNHTATIVQVGRTERVIFGTDGGIFVSEDGGKSFDSTKNVGIIALLAQTIMSTPQRDSSAITGLQDTGTRARIGSSRVWNQVLGGDGEGVGWSQANNAVTIASSQFVGLARQPGLPANTGNPNNWEDATTGINFTDLDCFPFFTPVATPTAQLDPTGLVFYTSTGSRLYKTIDGAKTWQQVVQFGTVAQPQCLIRLGTWHTTRLHPVKPNLISLTGASGRALISQDAGATWSISQLISVVPGYTGFNASSVWTMKDALYFASESPTPGAVRVVKTTNFGQSWSRADNGLPDVGISDIAVDTRDRSGNTLFAATQIGVYWTKDGGANWTLFGAGLPNVSVRSLYVSPEGEFMRIATYGRGVWEIDLEH